MLPGLITSTISPHSDGVGQTQTHDAGQLKPYARVRVFEGSFGRPFFVVILGPSKTLQIPYGPCLSTCYFLPVRQAAFSAALTQGAEVFAD